MSLSISVGHLEDITPVLLDYSSYALIDVALLSNIPNVLIKLIFEYSGKEQWHKIDQAWYAPITKFFFATASCKCGKVQSIFDQAIANGDIPKAISSIRWGASPTLSRNQFKSLLLARQDRMIGFVFSQTNKETYDISLYHEVSGALEELDPPVFTRGLMLYLSHTKKICIHMGDKFYSLATKKADNNAIRILDVQKEKWNCEDCFLSPRSPTIPQTPLDEDEDHGAAWHYRHSRWGDSVGWNDRTGLLPYANSTRRYWRA